ncbi:hypothetical protein D1AOALGA4SA_9296 [Olavius algarvensis Delta 1 endosymbiont]|nr:hypothetical protein D1AOALGA4SA_9296 [Olavius algarvensis Delta 1 endosymbiont]
MIRFWICFLFTAELAESAEKNNYKAGCARKTKKYLGAVLFLI